ncbi:MAG: hypothetical protein JWO86_4505 [Myxococcaceae bacterium]|jgi:hypothetical protein|nr:hypothetical protein [Myxococcaceae bacterium]MEA2747964.1 hypothetical protein [Myxococcales bacterium]
MPSPRSLALAFTTLAAFASTSCFDPVHSDEVNALGGEVNGVGPGPNHRPGQPCRACHGGSGPASPEFTIAGTVYAQRDVAAAKSGVTVTITDATGATRQLTSNDVGNFYISIDQWSPVFPVNVKLDFPGVPTKGMVTPIGRNGACASCHYGADNELTHMPPVFLQQ